VWCSAEERKLRRQATNHGHTCCCGARQSWLQRIAHMPRSQKLNLLGCLCCVLILHCAEVFLIGLCGAAQSSAEQRRAAQRSAEQRSAAQRSAEQRRAAQSSAEQRMLRRQDVRHEHCAEVFSAAHSSAQQHTAAHSSAQQRTAAHSSANNTYVTRGERERDY